MNLDALRHAPRRTQHDVLQGPRENRRLLADLARNDALGVNNLTTLHEADHELRHVRHHVQVTEIGRHPPPHLHVRKNARLLGLDLLVAATVLRLVPKLHELFAQAHELHMLGIGLREIFVRRIGRSEPFEDDLRIDELRTPVEMRIELLGWRKNAPPPRVTCIEQCGPRQSEFCLRLGFGVPQRVRLSLRQHERLRIEPIVSRSLDLIHERGGLVGESAITEPQRLIGPRSVEGFERGRVLALLIRCRLRNRCLQELQHLFGHCRSRRFNLSHRLRCR